MATIQNPNARKNPTLKIKQIEKILGTEPDGVWDAEDRQALEKLTTGRTPKAVPQPEEPSQPMGMKRIEGGEMMEPSAGMMNTYK